MEDNATRKSYTLYDKRKAVEKANEFGIREASRQLGIPRKNLQRWSKQMEAFKLAALNPGINVQSKRRIRQSKAKYPLVESALLDYFKEERGKRNSVTGKQIRRKALVLFPGNNERFSAFLKSLGDFDIIMNMDETPCYFDMPSSTTFDLKGVRTVKVRTTGNEKLRFTAVFTAVVRKIHDHYERISLPPMVIFKNLTKAPKR